MEPVLIILQVKYNWICSNTHTYIYIERERAEIAFEERETEVTSALDTNKVT